MNIAIVGTGYVGLTTGSCFADVGHNVICVDIDEAKIASLKQGKVTFFEPGLDEVIQRNVAAGRLSFTTELSEALPQSAAVFIAVPTPSADDGTVELHFVDTVAKQIGELLTPGDFKVIVDKSTVPVKTGERVTAIVNEHGKEGIEFAVVSNPEFLREGSAVGDLMEPDRIVIGSNSDRASEVMWEIYKPFPTKSEAHRLTVDLNSAELIKHAANSFLALKISFINAVSAICDASDADVEMVAKGIGMDDRIGPKFLHAGLGYGGSCFPKDVSGFLAVSRDLGVPFELLQQVIDINNSQLDRFVAMMESKLGSFQGKNIAVWGIAFKANTDDLRESVSVKLMRRLVDAGAEIRAYDAQGAENFAKQNPEYVGEGKVTLVDSSSQAIEGVDALVVATEWPEFRDADFDALKSALPAPHYVFDGRNLLNAEDMVKRGFDYTPIGRAGFIKSLQDS